MCPLGVYAQYDECVTFDAIRFVRFDWLAGCVIFQSQQNRMTNSALMIRRSIQSHWQRVWHDTPTLVFPSISVLRTLSLLLTHHQVYGLHGVDEHASIIWKRCRATDGRGSGWTGRRSWRILFIFSRREEVERGMYTWLESNARHCHVIRDVRHRISHSKSTKWNVQLPPANAIAYQKCIRFFPASNAPFDVWYTTNG